MPLTHVSKFLPADANDLWREDFLEPAPKGQQCFRGGNGA